MRGVRSSYCEVIKEIHQVENVIVDIPGGNIKVTRNTDITQIQDKLNHLGVPGEGTFGSFKGKSLVSCVIGRIARD